MNEFVNRGVNWKEWLSKIQKIIIFILKKEQSDKSRQQVCVQLDKVENEKIIPRAPHKHFHEFYLSLRGKNKRISHTFARARWNLGEKKKPSPRQLKTFLESIPQLILKYANWNVKTFQRYRDAAARESSTF